jgi:hypothetical protein
MAINQDKLNELLDQVSNDVLTILTKADETQPTTLKKADPGEETPGEQTPSGSSTEGSTPDNTDESSASNATPTAQSSAPAPAADPAVSATPDQGSADTDPATDDGSPEALQAEYAKLPVEELKLHVMAAHAALMAAVSAGQPQGSASAQPPVAQPVQSASVAPGSAPEDTQSMGKKEFGSEGNGGQVKAGKMAKSESAQKDLELKIEQLEKSVKERDEQLASVEARFNQAADGLVTFMNKQTGLRKSISGISYDNKPGNSVDNTFKPMAKSEALLKLNALTASKDLKKSDRELINQYVLGTADQVTVAHLLK